MDELTFSVGELCETLRAALELTFPDEVWVRGEIHDLKRPPSGHVYFDLVDPGELGRSVAGRISVALFANHKFRVNAILKRAGGSVRMTDGVEIRVRGRIEFHPPTGQLKLVMSLIDPAYTLGQLALDRERLLRVLDAEGLLHRNRTRPLGPAPLRVAMVTSSGSAAAHDFLHELAGSGFAFDVVEVHASVQGDGAPAAIAAALRRAEEAGVDVVALVRGGGARTDLATFDGEDVARAIATCAVPVWTGIGHEIDRTVADEVAHRSFKTPTACAAALVEVVASFLAEVEGRWAGITARARAQLEAAELGMAARARQLGRDVTAALRLADDRLRSADQRLRREAELALRSANEGLQRREALRRAYDPARTLARGWSITRRADGVVVRRPSDAPPGTELVTSLAEGELASRVIDPAEAGGDGRAVGRRGRVGGS